MNYTIKGVRYCCRDCYVAEQVCNKECCNGI
jgi:hypothetical protein